MRRLESWGLVFLRGCVLLRVPIEAVHPSSELCNLLVGPDVGKTDQICSRVHREDYGKGSVFAH